MEPEINDLLNLFEQKVEIKNDSSYQTYEKQMQIYGYVEYTIKNSISPWHKIEKKLKFYKSTKKAKISLKKNSILYRNNISELLIDHKEPETPYLQFNLRNRQYKKPDVFHIAINSEERAGMEPEINDLLNLFDFEGKGTIKIDLSKGVYEKQMKNNGYVNYIITDHVSKWETTKKEFRFYRSEKKAQVKLKTGANLYGNPISKKDNQFRVTNRLDRVAIKPDIEEIKKQFIFKGTGSIEIENDYEDKMKNNGYVRYFVTDTISNWEKNTKELRFYKSDIKSEITIKLGSNLNGYLVELNNDKENDEYFSILNKNEKILDEIDINFIKSLFNFKGEGRIIKKYNDYNLQIKSNDYIEYILEDKVSAWHVKTRKLRIYHGLKRPKVKLKSNAELYGEKMLRMSSQYNYVLFVNNEKRAGQQPDINLIKSLFEFEIEGSVELDTSKGTYQEQMIRNGYAVYNVVDTSKNGLKHEVQFKFQKSNSKAKISLKKEPSLYGRKISSIKKFKNIYKKNIEYLIFREESYLPSKETDTEEIKNMFEFENEGKVEFDSSKGKYEEQMQKNNYVSYIITDTATPWDKKIINLKFFSENFISITYV